MPSYRLLLLILPLTLLVNACATAPTPTPELPTVAVLPTETATPTLTPTLDISDTPSPTPTETATPTPSDTPTPSATPTATEDIAATAYIATEQTKLTQIAENENLLLTLDAAGVIPTETNTPVPISDLPPTLYYAQESARVRTCTQLDEELCPTRRELLAGNPIMVTGETIGGTFRDSNRWYRVDLSGEIAFVHTALVADAPPTPTLSPDNMTGTALAPTLEGVATLAIATPMN